MKLWEGLEQDFNYNAMVSQRGVLNLYHSDAQRDAYARRGNAMRLHGVDAELLDREQVRAMLPFLELRRCALPDPGRAAAAPRRHRPPRCRGLGLRARRERHAASTSSRTARSRGCSIENGRIAGVADNPRADPREEGRHGGRGQHVAPSPRWRACACRSKATCCRPSCPRGSSRSSPASSPSGPAISTSASPTRAGWCSAATSTATTPTPSAATCRRSRTCCEGGMALMPMIGRVRHPAQLGRHHGHVDGRLARSSTGRPIEGLYLNAGWCYGGFKATPASGWCFAHLIAKDEPHPRRDAPTGSTASPPAPSSTKRARAPNRTCTEDSTMRIPMPLLRRTRRARVRLSRRRAPSPRPDPADAGCRARSSTTSTCATTRPARMRSSGITPTAAAPGSWWRATRSPTTSTVASLGAETAP